MRRCYRWLAAAAATLLATAALAFPTRPIVVIVPYAVGGSTDVLARLLADAMSRDLGQPVVIENTSGAGGTIGTTKVATANADGHTILFHNMGITTAPALYSKLPYDVIGDLAPIAEVGDVPMIFVGGRNFAPTTLGEVLALMRNKPDELRFAHAGVGATSHLCALLLVDMTGTRATMVPYRGTGPAMQDVIAGSSDAICDQPVATGPHLRSGMLKPYALATSQRLPTLPDVPTFAEAGLPGFELAVWHGFYAPKATPAATIDRLNQAIRNALQDPATSKRMVEMGVVIPAGDRLQPRSLATRTEAELKRWAPIIKAAGAQLN